MADNKKPFISFFSTNFHDVIPFERVVGLEDNQGLTVMLESKHKIQLHKKDVEEFKKQYELYLHMVQSMAFGFDIEETTDVPKRKSKI